MFLSMQERKLGIVQPAAFDLIQTRGCGDFTGRITRLLVLAAMVAVPAWGQETPKLPGPPPDRPLLLPRDMARICAAKCENPCATWASWQPDFQSSYEACTAS